MKILFKPQTEWLPPEEFKDLEQSGLEMGFKHVAAGPLVRSSYHADEQHNAAIDKILNPANS